jgi:hypothetical protein
VTSGNVQELLLGDALPPLEALERTYDSLLT